jgi:DNA adenine methylase
MHYFGGKYRIADKIADFINPLFKPNQYYVEPFVGGASILTKITNPLRIASDANETLITMWKALANGWTPPNFVSENEYAEIKEKNDKNDPLTAFVGFGCSYSGKWFGGYARDDTTRNYAMNAANSLYKKNKCLVNVEWQCGDYKNIVSKQFYNILRSAVC